MHTSCASLAFLLVAAFPWSTSSIPSNASPCPKQCNVCFSNFLFCDKGGLLELPRLISLDAKRLRFENHYFQDPILRRVNLSRYASKKKFAIEKIWIRNCSVNHIEPMAFSDLHSLTWLDLASNEIGTILPRTFSGLKLSYLSLDSNPHLHLTKESFEGLSVEKLSIRSCQLKTILTDTLKPLLGNLATLSLEGNHLSTLTESFELVLRKVAHVELRENPFHCSCSLFWLARSYQWKQRQSVSFDKKPITLSNATSTSPVCHTPNRLAMHSFHSLKREDLFCDPPRLKFVEVNWKKIDEVSVSCHAVGSPEMTMLWKSTEDVFTAKAYSSTNKTFLHVNKFNKSVARIVRPSKEARNQPTSVTCIARDTEGSVQANVNIFWNAPVSPLPTVDDAFLFTVANMQEESSDWHKFFRERRFTLIQFLLVIIGTILITIVSLMGGYVCLAKLVNLEPSEENHSLFQSCFSNSKIHQHPDTLSYSPSHHSNSYFRRNGTNPRQCYVVYESPASSDSQTYDVPLEPSPVKRHLPYHLHEGMSSPSHGPLIDFRTHQLVYS